MVAKVVNLILYLEGYDPFALVQSRQPPVKAEAFKEKLGTEEVFDTDFVGASVEECRTWARRYQDQFGSAIERDLFFIMDERSAKDQTLSLQYYNRGEGIPNRYEGLHPEEGGPPYREDELLPQKAGTWYTFRIRPKDFNQATADLLMLTASDAGLEYWFARAAGFTTEDGIFDVDAKRRAL